jgi:hypothetical protein
MKQPSASRLGVNSRLTEAADVFFHKSGLPYYRQFSVKQAAEYFMAALR